MSASIPDLWGDGIDVDNLSPMIILNTQAAILEKRTKGVITAEVIKRKTGDVTELIFDIKSQVARHRSRLLTCRHFGYDVYPVWVTSESLRHDDPAIANDIPESLNLDQDSLNFTEVIWGQDRFLGAVLDVFQSLSVKARISSMLAISNEGMQPLDYLNDQTLNATEKS